MFLHTSVNDNGFNRVCNYVNCL